VPITLAEVGTAQGSIGITFVDVVLNAPTHGCIGINVGDVV